MRRVLLGVAIVLAVGCKGPESPGREKSMFPDLPAPEGFTYEEGYGHISAAFRTYTQTYQGQRRLDETANWYKQVFPAPPHQWSLKAETPGDPATLTFVKKAEQVVVTLASDSKAGVKIVVKIDKKGE